MGAYLFLRGKPCQTERGWWSREFSGGPLVKAGGMGRASGGEGTGRTRGERVNLAQPRLNDDEGLLYANHQEHVADRGKHAGPER